MLACSVLYVFTTLHDCIVLHKTRHPFASCVNAYLEHSCHIVYRELIRKFIILLYGFLMVAAIGRCVAKLVVEVLLG